MPFQFLGAAPPHADQDRARVVVVPVPFDGTTCYKAGAREGPYAILAASPHMEFYDEETETEIRGEDIYTVEPLEPVLPPEEMIRRVREAVEPVLRSGKFPVILGGEHSVSIGAIEAAHRARGRLNIVQFDAHADLRDAYQGTPYSHACVMRRVWPLGNIVQVGIRSLSKEEMEFLRDRRAGPIWAREVRDDLQNAVRKCLALIDDCPTYVTIDLDCLDPSIMPAVGTPEPGGLLWADAMAFLKALAGSTEIVGFDVVELAPIPGYHAADYTAARLIYKFLGHILSSKP
jgi:agmatinase